MSTPWSGQQLAASPFTGEFDAESPFAGAGANGESPGYPAYQEFESPAYPAYQEFERTYGLTSTPELGAEAAGLPLAHESPEQSRVRQAIAAGTSDVNALTNLVFFARHPERNGRGLSPSEPGFAALGAEWTTIRDTVVRPLMTASPPPATRTGSWVPGAERLANPKSGGGTYLDAPWRFIFHTIEGEPSAQGFRTLAAGHANPPHLWAMPSADLLLQTIPLDRSAYALARPGSIQTNRLRAVQVECWGFAAKMVDATPEVLTWLADRVLAPVARLVPIDLNQVRPTGPGEPCYGKNSSCRMRPDEWQAFNGVGGHNCVPDNEHWDPGQLDLMAIAQRARAIVGGGTSYIRRERPLADHDGPGFEAERDDGEGPGGNGHRRTAWMDPTAGPVRETVAWARETAPPGSDEVKWVQSSLNRVMGSGLAVDGVLGPLTRAAIMDFQRREGLVVDGIAGPVTKAALQRGTGTGGGGGASTPGPSAGVGSFDGVPVANWLIPYLSWARQNGWQGRLNSGWRSPEHSERLCFEKCGAATCPGTCAGRSSNHSADVKPKGAIDVSDEARFAELMARCPLSPRIFNDLSKDRIHFSATGG